MPSWTRSIEPVSGAAFGPWRARPRFRPSLAAAAVVAVLVSGALLLTRPNQPAISDPSPPLGASPSPSQPALTPTPTASQPAVQSLELTWTEVALDGSLGQVAWLDDRFVLVDDSGAVRTSPDGASWQVLQPGDYDPGYGDLLKGSFVSWGDDVVGWWNPEDGPDFTNKPPVTARDILRIVRPPAAPTETTPFKGRIESIGIGPTGIVAQVHSHLDWDAWVATKLGDDWVSRYEDVELQGRDPRDHDGARPRPQGRLGGRGLRARATTWTPASAGTAPMASSGR